jgi:hypothetical protein
MVQTHHEETTGLPPTAPSTPSSQSKTFLLIAALLILIGFFLPWINTGFGGGRNSDFDEEMLGGPTINGTYLITLAGKVPEVGWLLAIFLILVPLGSIIVAINSQQKTFSEKAMMFGVASSVYIPLSLFALYLVIPKQELFGNRGNLAGFGVGFILMLIGSAYCFIYAIGRIFGKMKHISGGPIFTFGMAGGVIAGVLTYLIFDNIKGSDVSILYIYLGIVIFGILLSGYLYRSNASGNSNYHSSIVSGFVFSAAYSFTLFIIVSIVDKTGMNRFSQVFIFILVTQCLFGFIISSLSGGTVTASTLYTPAAGSTDIHDARMNAVSTQSPPLPPQETRPPFDSAAFVRKNKKLFIAGLILIAAGITLWILLKPDPENDGRKAAKAECNCKTENDKAITKTYEDFISSFDSAHYRSRGEAREKLQELITKLDKANQLCKTTATENYEKARDKYIKDYRKYSDFEKAYNKGLFSCVSDSGSTSLAIRFEEKLKSINDPEPDIEKIKLDLINQSIPGWTFNYISEITSATVANTTRIGDRIEYTIDLKLENYSTHEQSDAQIIIAYDQGDNGWGMSKMSEVFITFTNTAPVNEWKTITPLSNCSYAILDGGHKYWVQDGAYGTKYQGGGSDGQTFRLTSPTIYIESREDQPVKIIFRYTPNSQ